MPAKPVVVNSTPLVAFWAIGRLDILHSLFGEIVIPPAVREEFLSTEKEARRKALRDESWIRVVELETQIGQALSQLWTKAKPRSLYWQRNKKRRWY